ncbi:MAG: VWA domain-containing protein [Chromatiaceae bacterium]|jgi:uncharacterized protein (TIGR03503 family)
MQRWRAIPWSLVVVLLSLQMAPLRAATPDYADVRVLIDISGSMRQNDPQNLRRPALRMLAGLLQPGTRAGVWTFARWTNNLVPVAEVDAAWKTRTRALSAQIGSPGQFTNIEAVLEKASADWQGEPATHSRHLVLLTDGMVDVSKQAADNRDSRTRVIDELLPRLKGAGIKVHTIALSERADHDLMQRLAGETGGWYQQIAQADELQRVFLRMFETVGEPDTVPLQDNRFVVDGSVTEATVLVFGKPDSPPVLLRSPSGAEYSDSDLPAGIAWSHDQGYDMITIAAPEKGEWSLQADLDPDNRVMIVTDLKLQTSEVPSHVAAGEGIRVEVGLTNRGEPVTRQAFLRLLEVRADAMARDTARPLDLNDLGQGDDAEPGDGRYTMRYSEVQATPNVELLIAVDSPTFMREKRFRLAVHEPVIASVSDGADGWVLTIAAAPAVLQPGAQLNAWQQGADGQRIPLSLIETAAGQWTAWLSDPLAPSFVQVSGKSRLDNPIDRTLGPILPDGVMPPTGAAAPPAVPEAAEPVPTPQAEPEVPLVADPATGEAGWIIPLVSFGAFNLVLLIATGVWLRLRRRRVGVTSDPAPEAKLEMPAEVDIAPSVDPLQEDAA